MPTPETTILDDRAVGEIEARARKYKQLAERAATPADEDVIRWFAKTVRALCATVKHLRAENARLSALDAEARLSHQENTSMTKNYDDFRAGMLRAAEMARDEFKRAPEAAKGHDCVYMGGYEDACDHLSVVIAQAAVIDSVRIAGSQPDWQYHIALLLPDGAVEDQALLKIYQVVEHELGLLQSQLEQLRAENERLLRGDFTAEELQGFCHNLSEQDRNAFFEGCTKYQERLFGTSAIAQLKAKENK